MIVAGFYNDHVYWVDASGSDAGMDCCHITSPSQFYFDDKVVLPIMLPGIMRTSKLKTIRSHGHGYGGSCGYRDPSNAVLEINSLAEVHWYQTFSSDNKRYEKDNMTMVRFLGMADADLKFGLCAYATSNASLTNCLNDTSISDIDEFLYKLCTQLYSTRHIRTTKTAWSIHVDNLVDSLEKVNIGEISRAEAKALWTQRVYNRVVINDNEFFDLPIFTFDATTTWSNQNG